jgi:hypothetical protein
VAVAAGLMRPACSILVHPRDIAQAARHAVNDLEDSEAWPEEGLAHRELDMVQLRLNNLMLRNAPARVARGRRQRDPRAQARRWSRRRRFSRRWRAPSCLVPTRCCDWWGSNPDLGQRPPSGLYNSPAFLLRTFFGRSIRPAFPKFRGCC